MKFRTSFRQNAIELTNPKYVLAIFYLVNTKSKPKVLVTKALKTYHVVYLSVSFIDLEHRLKRVIYLFICKRRRNACKLNTPFK